MGYYRPVQHEGEQLKDALRAILVDRGEPMRLHPLAARLDCSFSFVSQLLRGERGLWFDGVNRIVRRLELNRNDAIRLHRAAARTRGYEID